MNEFLKNATFSGDASWELVLSLRQKVDFVDCLWRCLVVNVCMSFKWEKKCYENKKLKVGSLADKTQRFRCSKITLEQESSINPSFIHCLAFHDLPWFKMSSCTTIIICWNIMSCTATGNIVIPVNPDVYNVHKRKTEYFSMYMKFKFLNMMCNLFAHLAYNGNSTRYIVTVEGCDEYWRGCQTLLTTSRPHLSR